MFKLRWYQRRGAKKIFESLEKGNHPCGVFPTGSGKTIIICSLTSKYLDNYIENDVLIISHRKKILSQNHSALSKYFPDNEIGMYSAGLKSKTIKKITVAGIQSIWRKPELFQNVGLIIIDEAHLINHSDEGMYRDFLGKIPAQFVGLTATPFRLGHGYIYKGENAIFNDLAYDLSSTENYNKLVSQGYLSPMYSMKTKFVVDTSDIKLKGKEFDQESSKKKFDRDSITDVACNEIVRVAAEERLKKWLIFAIDIEHAENICSKIKSLGVSCVCIHSKVKMQDERLEMYENGIYKCAVNVDMLTTGLDIAKIDLIGVLKPTQSPALHVQILGRGGRPVYSEGYDLSKRSERLKAIKNGVAPKCLVLDFAGNVNRLGPINSVMIEENYDKAKSKGNGEAITKICPNCETIAYAASRNCEQCGHKFEFLQKITEKSSTSEIVTSLQKLANGIILEVDSVSYSVHQKIGKPSSLLVKYFCNSQVIREYVSIDHGGYARHLANQWIRCRIKHGERKPRNLSELFKIKGDLRVPKQIVVKMVNGYTNVENWVF